MELVAKKLEGKHVFALAKLDPKKNEQVFKDYTYYGVRQTNVTTWVIFRDDKQFKIRLADKHVSIAAEIENLM